MNSENVDIGTADPPAGESIFEIPNSPRPDFDPPQQQVRSSEELLISDGQNQEHGLSFEASTPPPRSLTFIHGLALVIGFQIGSGIFSAPAAVRSHVSSTALAMLAWVVGGVIAATGAASFSTLGKLIPLNGGIQEFLRFIYGDLFGFLFAWVWIFVSRPLALAMVSLIFSEYLFKAILPEQTIPSWALKLSAISAVVVITWLNCMGTRIGTGIGNVFLFLKIIGLGSIAIAGISVFIFGSSTSREPPTAHPQLRRTGMGVEARVVLSSGFSEAWVSFGGFVEAILAAAFATGGWESLSFVGGEIKDPDTTLPRILRTAMSFTISLFLTSNFALYVTVPLEKLKETDAPALEFGNLLFGRAGVFFYAWIVCLCCLGSLNSNVFSTSRLTQAASDRHYIPSFLRANASSTDEHGQSIIYDYLLRYLPLRGSSSQRLKNDNIPRNAMILNCLLAALYVVLGSFRRLLTFKGMMEYFVYLFTVLGLFVLRVVRHRGSAQQTKADYGSIWSPLVFCCIVGPIVLQSAVTHLLEFALILVYLGVCSGLYYKWFWRQAARTATSSLQLTVQNTLGSI